ncbi:Uncharacterised protein [Bordetella pertussis]|nr:Uncharacterised protein [Bordetella pertussis]
MPESVFERALLDRDLGRGRQVLHGTAAANAEMRAARRHALRGRAQDLLDLGNLVGRLAAHRLHRDPLAGQGAFHEQHFAVTVGYPPGLEVQGLNIQNVDHLAQSRYTGRPAL